LAKQIPTAPNGILDRCIEQENSLSEPEERAYSAELGEILKQALSQLPPKQIQAINLSYIEEKGHFEASKEADCSVLAFKDRRTLARKRLRGLLDQVKPE